MQIIDNFLSEDKNNELYNIVLHHHFPWYYNPHTSGNNTHATAYTKETPQFTHMLYHTGTVHSKYADLLELFFDTEALKTRRREDLLRAKFNLITKHADYNPRFYHSPHIDWGDHNGDIESVLYYVNDSDGDTIIFNEKTGNELTERYRITPKKNKAVIFDSSYLHSSTPPIKQDVRIVLNLVYKRPE